MTHARSIPLPALCLCVCASLPAAAQSGIEVREGYEVITPQAFRKLPEDTPPGRKFTIHYVRFHKLFGQELKLYGGVFPDGRQVRSFLHGRLVVEDRPSRRALLENLKVNRDSDGKRLVPKKSWVQLFGIGMRTPKGYVLSVNRVHLLGSQADRLRELHAALAPDDAQGRVNLVRTLRRAVRYFPDEAKRLEPLLAKLLDEARNIERAQLPALPQGVSERIRFARRYRSLDVLVEAWSHPEVSAEDKARLAESLRVDLHARRYLGRWIARDELQERLGMARDAQGKWVPAFRVRLLEASAAEKKRRKEIFLKPTLDRTLLEVAMGKGDVIEGMDKNMVLAARSAYPLEVDRVREEHERGKLVWEYWRFADGLEVYFANGYVFKKAIPESEKEDEE